MNLCSIDDCSNGAVLFALRKQNRILKILCFVSFLFLAAFVWMGLGDPKTSTIEAKKLIIKDDQGITRATLGGDEIGRFGLIIFNEEGDSQAALISPRKGQAGLFLFDKDESIRASLSSTKESCSLLTLDAPDGKGRVVIDTDPHSPPLISIIDEKGNTRSKLTFSNNNGSSLLLKNKDGESIFKIP